MVNSASRPTKSDTDVLQRRWIFWSDTVRVSREDVTMIGGKFAWDGQRYETNDPAVFRSDSQDVIIWAENTCKGDNKLPSWLVRAVTDWCIHGGFSDLTLQEFIERLAPHAP